MENAIKLAEKQAEWRRKQKQLQDLKMERECTFKPNIVKSQKSNFSHRSDSLGSQTQKKPISTLSKFNTLYLDSKRREQKQEQLRQDSLLRSRGEQEKECTFKPVLNKPNLHPAKPIFNFSASNKDLLSQPVLSSSPDRRLSKI